MSHYPTVEIDACELGKPFYGFRYKFLDVSEHEETLKILEKELFPALSPIGYDPKFSNDFIEFFSRMMKRNMSYIAIHEESGEIAACRMVDLVEKGVESDITVRCPSYVEAKSNIKIFNLLWDMCKDIDLFEEYRVTQYPFMFGLCVKEKYRQKGIAGEMYRRGLKYFQMKGFDIVKCGFVSPYTRRAGYRNGFVEFSRRYYHECRDENGMILNPESDPTDFIDFGVFDLRKELYTMRCLSYPCSV